MKIIHSAGILVQNMEKKCKFREVVCLKMAEIFSPALLASSSGCSVEQKHFVNVDLSQHYFFPTNFPFIAHWDLAYRLVVVYKIFILHKVCSFEKAIFWGIFLGKYISFLRKMFWADKMPKYEFLSWIIQKYSDPTKFNNWPQCA